MKIKCTIVFQKNAPFLYTTLSLKWGVYWKIYYNICLHKDEARVDDAFAVVILNNNLGGGHLLDGGILVGVYV